MWIAWNINSDEIRWPPTFEEKVEIFYQRTLGWQLHVADLLANGGQPLGATTYISRVDHSGFAVLQICLSYFETIGHYEHGVSSPNPKGTAGYFFKMGVRSVMPRLPAESGETLFDELLDALYGGARCGLYHNSMTVPNIGLGQPFDGEPVGYDPEAKRLAISPERLPRALKVHLEQFRARLLDPQNVALRQKFEGRFNVDNGIMGRTP